MSGEHMQFPPTWENFIDLYGFIDRENIYTNGSELIQTFRVKIFRNVKNVKKCIG